MIKKSVFLIGIFLFANSKIDKILTYHFNIDLDSINSPFFKHFVISNKKASNKSPSIIKFDYKLVSIIDSYAKIKVIKYINNDISNIQYVLVKKGTKLQNCYVLSIKNDFIKLKCANSTKVLSFSNNLIPYIKEMK